MVLFDQPLEALRSYRPRREEPADFDEFWSSTLDGARQHDIDARFVPIDVGLHTVDAFDVTFAGWNREPISAWFLVPKHRTGPLPCVVEYMGYGGGRGHVFSHLLYSSAGYAHLVMDSRGQGGADTADRHTRPGSPHTAGFLTDGVLDPATHYYRRLMTDAARAVDAARDCALVDPSRIVVAGVSQGGGLAIAAAALVSDLRGIISEIPFLCDFRRATELTDKDPYQEIAVFCRRQPRHIDQVFRTLAYFDGANFAPRATAPALFSVGMMDDVCPPSTVFAAYNGYGGSKDIRVWPYNLHEKMPHQIELNLNFLRTVFA